MIKPNVLQDEKNFVELIKVFDTPMGIVPDISIIPMIEIFTVAGFTYWAKSRNPDRPLKEHIYSGILCMLVSLGSEWAHNMAHVFAAKLIGKPADAVRIVFGMPLLHYRDLNDPTISPKAHLVRASGGPILNLVLLPLGRIWRNHTRPDSVNHNAAEVFVAMNAFLLLAGLQPIPGLDGGAVLKWALVDQGLSIPKADETVRKSNWISAALLTISSTWAFLKHKRLFGGILALLAGLSILVAKGYLKETENLP